MKILAINIFNPDSTIGHVDVAFQIEGEKFWSAKRAAVTYDKGCIYLTSDTIDFIIKQGQPLSSFEADVRFNDDNITPTSFFKPL